MSADISGIIQSTGVALEREAFTQFGAAVADTGGGMLRDVFGVPPGNPTGTGTNQTVQENGVWDGTRYAAALVKPDQVDYNPKLKFLFKVSFKFDPALIDAAWQLGYDLTTLEQNATFMIRHVDRPKFDYEYEEVNMYNFRTKVLKSIRHREVSFTLYDDVGNNVLSFINLYRKLQQPITRSNQSPSMHHEDYGFQFDRSLHSTDTAMRGILPGDVKNILQKMTIHQIFVERGNSNGIPSSWVKTVDFVFMNPRFTNIDLDDMDHENGGSFNLITIAADFDSMFMDEPRNFTQNVAPALPSGDIPANGSNGATNAQGKGGNPFINIIANQTKRGVTQSVSNLINKTLSTTAGGAAFSGQLSGISSLIGEQAKRTLSGIGDFARGNVPFVSDESTPRSQVPDLSSRDE